jgi:hypothetical protein
MFVRVCSDCFYLDRYSVAAFGSRRARDCRAVMCFYVKSNYGATFRLPVINAFCLLPLFIDGITFGRAPVNAQFWSAKLQTIFIVFEI